MDKSILQLALERGLAAGGKLSDELRRLRDYRIRSEADANAICGALRTVLEQPTAPEPGLFSSPLYNLVTLFQKVEAPESEAFRVLHAEGVPLLVQAVDDRLETSEGEDDDVLMILKILATYRSHEGAQRIVRAARQSFKPEDYLWHVIFRALSAPDHPEQGFVFEQLRDPLPHGSIAGALLDGANRTAIAGGTIRHPFDSPAGHAQLGVWLADTPEHGLAQSATAALPFIAPPARDSLLAAAMAHQDEAVRLEAAWAAAKLGDEAGIEALTEVCLEVNRSVIARRYLSELERRDAIPRAALEPDFLARAEFANWLSHPNELGRYPDEVEILDSRHLGWPPEHENKQCWVLRYRVLDSHGLGEEARGCGMVGSVTFCLFSYEMHLRPPEDVYAIHCAWEMKRSRLIRTLEPDKPDEYEGALKHWKGEPLSAVQILRVAELSPRLGAGSDVLTLASAHLSGAAGWVVLDGARSAWYPASGMPEDAPASTVLDLHIGRRLLGFTDRPDRQRWLSEGSPIEPDNLVRAWERLQSQASEQPNPDLSDQVSALAKHVEAYADSCATVRNETRSSAFIRGFEQILDLARSNADALGDDAFSTFGPLGKKLEAYVAASLEAGSHDAVASIVDFLTPHWDHNSGYGTLGAWLFHAGLHEKAERFFLKLRESYQDWQRSEQMSLLARIWVGQGKPAEAESLLLECLMHLSRESKQARGTDRKLFERWFHNHRTTFLELFPEGEEVLRRHGVPVTTLS